MQKSELPWVFITSISSMYALTYREYQLKLDFQIDGVQIDFLGGGLGGAVFMPHFFAREFAAAAPKHGVPAAKIRLWRSGHVAGKPLFMRPGGV